MVVPVLVVDLLPHLAAVRLPAVVVGLVARVSLFQAPALPPGAVVVVLVAVVVVLADVPVVLGSGLRAERVVVVVTAKNCSRWTRRRTPRRTHPFLRERLSLSVPQPRLILVRS